MPASRTEKLLQEMKKDALSQTNWQSIPPKKKILKKTNLSKIIGDILEDTKTPKMLKDIGDVKIVKKEQKKNAGIVQHLRKTHGSLWCISKKK